MFFADRARPAGQHPDDPGDGGLPHQAVGAHAGAGAVGAQPVPQRLVERALIQAAEGLPQIRLLPGKDIMMMTYLHHNVKPHRRETAASARQFHSKHFQPMTVVKTLRPNLTSTR